MLSAGTQIGHFAIAERIGGGGMGEVYRARDLRSGRDVAFKIVPEHLSDDETAVARFEREIWCLAAVSHPNVLAMYEHGSEGPILYTALELLVGETLHARIRRSPIPWRDAA